MKTSFKTINITFLYVGAVLVAVGVTFSIFGILIANANQTTYPLHWSPPQLDNPTIINLSAGATSITLNPNKDYIIRFPNTKKIGYTWISGGRNIVILGGHLTTPFGYTQTSERRALYIKEATGTVHIEGLLIDSSGGGEHDAIAINAPDAIVQIQNVRVENLKGSYASEHSDIIQPWGGVKELRVDRLTGSTNYQGFYLVQTQSASIGHVDIRNTNLIHQENPTQNVPAMIYMDDNCDLHPLSVAYTEVYINPHPSRPFQYTVEPATDNTNCGSILDSNMLIWPNTDWIIGRIYKGLPPDGDYVPRHLVGINYNSPGYANQFDSAPNSNSDSSNSLHSQTGGEGENRLNHRSGNESIHNTSTKSKDNTSDAGIESIEKMKSPLTLTIANNSRFDDYRPILTGTAHPESKVEVSILGVGSQVVITAKNGTWTFTPDIDLPEGDYAYSARLINEDGSYGEWVGPIRFAVQVSDDRASRALTAHYWNAIVIAGSGLLSLLLIPLLFYRKNLRRRLA